jgi:spore coat polysaccharide biosynthesis predicted glycosyltransferase SpsG/CMP-N-acetylneuraminic acid synthetase
MERLIIIPAIKKNVAFDNDLVKKIAGIMLIQRAFNLAMSLEKKSQIWVITDSQEIELMCQRQNIHCLKDAVLCLDENPISSLYDKIKTLPKSEHIFLLWPYCPLLKPKIINEAWSKYKAEKGKAMISVRASKADLIHSPDGLLEQKSALPLYRKVRAFIFISRKQVEQEHIAFFPIVLSEPYADISSFHDWWVVEKLLKRRRILFHVIGNNKLGMGHIYRALTLAHEVTHHEVIFLCNKESDVALNKLAGYEYYLKSCESGEEINTILSMAPDLVINDVLNTRQSDIRQLKNAGIKVVNFEDLGTGALEADLVINELYDQPQFEGGSILWGHSFSFLRDEFTEAKVHRFCNKVDHILLTFGGSDPSNMTLKVLTTIHEYCITHNLKVNIVCGTGYLYKEELIHYLEQTGYPGFSCTFETGVISQAMEKAQIAIASNGRTTYELAHMNIPSIIIAHNYREHTHRFTVAENGFINLGVFDEIKDPEDITKNLNDLIFDTKLRRKLNNSMKAFNFLKNKERVFQYILELLDD